MNSVIRAAAFVCALAASGAAMAADHQVLMLNKASDGRAMQFEPAFLKIEPGDTVTFVPQDKGHNAETILDMIPEDAQTWKGKTNEALTVTLTAEGLYAFKCFPHYAMGMVGLIQVGDNIDNLTDLTSKKLPPRAQARMFELFAQTVTPTN